MTQKYVYFFGPQGTEGDATMKNALGGKGANLAEMAKLGLPVPAGFTISTEFCTDHSSPRDASFPSRFATKWPPPCKKTEEAMGMKFGDPEQSAAGELPQRRPAVDARHDGNRAERGPVARRPFPGLVKKSGNERFVYDAYRRLIMMYSDVVMEKAEDIEPAEGKGIRVQLEHIMAGMKRAKKLQPLGH